jgi:hypothetical protein
MAARGLDHVRDDIKRAAQAGDRAALGPLVAEFRQRAGSAQQSQINAGEKYDATDGMSGLDKFHVGMASGLVNVGRRAGQLLTPKSLESKIGVSDADIDEQTNVDRDLRKTGAGMAGSLVSEIALTAPVAGAAGNVVRGVAGAGRLARAAALASEGATGGELTTGDATEGALYGLGIGGALAGARKIANGARRTAEAQALLDKGMDLTPGQMNPKGAINQMEAGAEHVPFLGAGVRNARESLSDQVLRKRLSEVRGKEVGPNTSIDDAMDETYEGLKDQYAHFERLPTVAGDGNKLLKGLRATIQKSPASEEAVKASARYLDNRMSALVNQSKAGGQVTVGDLVGMRSDLRSTARKLRKVGDLTAHERADVLEEAEKHLTGVIDNALLPSEQNAIRALDVKYAQYKPIETAFVAHRTGAPTARQQLTALKGTMTPGEYVSSAGPKNETKRMLQNALSVQASQATPTGIGYLFPKVGKYASPLVALTSGTRTGRRIAQGATGPQRALRKIGNTKTASKLAELLRSYRGGAAGAYTHDDEN